MSRGCGEELRAVQGRARRVVHHVQERAVEGNGRPAIPDVEGRQRPVLAALLEGGLPGHEVEVHGLDHLDVVVLVREEHDGPVGRRLGRTPCPS